jgi:hypothetical protein
MTADRQETCGASQHQQPPIMDAAWCDPEWTPWVSLECEAIRQTALGLPRVYRVRYADVRPGRLVYLRQTGRTLLERMLSLAEANAEGCPRQQPPTAARASCCGGG